MTGNDGEPTRHPRLPQPETRAPVRRKRLLRIVCHVTSWLVFLPLLGVLVLVLTLHFSLHPNRTSVRMSPKAYGLQEEDVTFITADGFELRGWFISGLSASDISNRELRAIQARRPTVVLCHDLHGVRDQMLPMARLLHEAGYNCLLFDFRGHGESGGEYTSFGLHERRDVLAAVAYVRQRAADLPWIDPEKVVVYGTGMGAVAAMTAAAEDEDIAAVIADTPFASLDGEFRRSAAERIPVPEFFASVYRIGFDCWFRDSADTVDARHAARRLRGRPLMVIAPPDGTAGSAGARTVFEHAAEAPAVLTVAGAAKGPRWTDDPRAIAESIKRFMRQATGGEDGMTPANPVAANPQLSPRSPRSAG